jgi:plasmid stability protein
MFTVNECENKRGACIVPILTVRNVPDELHGKLRLRAVANGRSMEAEVRDILKNTLTPERRIQMGKALAELGGHLGLTDADFAVFEQARQQSSAEPMNLE